jgi:hypothetical protein
MPKEGKNLMARDTGSYTVSTPPVTDPVQSLAATATNNTTAAVITYTTASAHNLKVGQPVVTSGFSNAWLNYNPDSATGNATPAVVASVTSSTVFTVNIPAVVATASSAVAGTVVQQALVSNSPYGHTWLPTTAQTNVVVQREWGSSFPIQPNDDRAANTALATSAPAGNGTQITYTVSSHSFVAGQQVSIQGVVPEAYNLENVTVAATTSTTVVVNSTVTAPVTSYTGGSIVAVNRLNGVFPAITSAVGATGAATVTKTTPAAVATGATSVGINNSTSIAVGGSISATGIAPNAVVTAIATNTVTISPATTGAVASAATLTFGSGIVNLYTTAQPHGLTAGQNVTVLGASVAPYNTSGIVQNASATTFSVKAPTFKISKVSGTSGSGAVGDGTNVLYYTDSAHGLAGGDTVNIGGFTPSGYNVVNGTVLTTPAPTVNTFAVANTTATAVTASGYGLKNSGSFSGTAKVSVEDSSWSAAYVTPSGNLVAALDNHDRVVNSERGYPDFTPSYTTPNLVGLTTTNAIQKIRAAGQTPGNVQFSTDITATVVATTTSTLQVTSGTAHNLAVGDTVYLSGSSNTTLNLGDAIVSSVPSTVSFIVNATGCTGTVGATALTFRPKNTIVSAQSPAAGATTATVVGFTRNYGI